MANVLTIEFIKMESATYLIIEASTGLAPLLDGGGIILNHDHISYLISVSYLK